MIDINEAVVAKYKNEGKVFEILVNSDNALLLRQGKDIDMNDILAVEKIFSDARKGREASQEEMESVFNTTDVFEIAKKIISKGDVPETTDHRNERFEEKIKKIVYLIHKNAVEPKNHSPIPEETIRDAIESQNVKIDPKRSAEEQMGEIIHKINSIVPMKIEIKKLQVKIPASNAQKAFNVLQTFSKFSKQEWLNDGTFVGEIEIPGGLEEEFYDKLNEITHGDNHVEILETK